MKKFTVIVERTERSYYTVEATTSEEAAANYLASDETSSETVTEDTVSVTEVD